MNKKYLNFIKKFLPVFLIPILAFGAYFAGGSYKNLGGGGGTINTLGGSLKIGGNVINGTPDSVLFIDNAGKLAEDSIFTRDSSTGASLIAMLQNSGVDSAGLLVDNDVFGLPGTNGVALRRGDEANAVGSVVIGLIDGTPLGAPSAYLGFMRADDIVTGEFFQQYFFPQSAGLSLGDGVSSSIIQFGADQLQLGVDNQDSGGNDVVYVNTDLNGGSGSQRLRAGYDDGTNAFGIQINSSGITFDYDGYSGTNGTFYRFPTDAGTLGDVLTTNGTNQLSWVAPALTASLTETQIGFGNATDQLSGNSNLTYESTYSLITQIVPVNTDSLSYGALSIASAGLDDLTLTWNSSVYASNKYGGNLNIAIDGTGSPDTFTWSFSGSYSQIIGSGSSIPITGGVQTLNDADGNKIAEIQFGADTGHTLSASWTASTSLGGNSKGILLRDTAYHEFLTVSPNGGAYRFGDDGTNGGSTWWGNGTNLTIQDGVGELGLFAPRYLRIEAPGGDTMVLADMENNIWDFYSDTVTIKTVSGLSTVFSVDTSSLQLTASVNIAEIGQNGAGNNTYWQLSDSAQTQYLRADTSISNRTLSWFAGDLGNSANSTKLTLSDSTQTFTFTTGGTDRFILYKDWTLIGNAFVTTNWQSYTSTGSVSINDNVSGLVYNPASVNATATITLPATSGGTGSNITIVFGGTITSTNPVVTALTIAPGSGNTIVDSNAPTTAVAGDSFSYHKIGNYWYRTK